MKNSTNSGDISNDIPTTDHMDGLYTSADIKNRHTVVFQCKSCRKWTTHYNWLPGEHNEHIPCRGCGETNYDESSIKSYRTYNPDTDNKRRPKIR